MFISKSRQYFVTYFCQNETKEIVFLKRNYNKLTWFSCFMIFVGYYDAEECSNRASIALLLSKIRKRRVNKSWFSFSPKHTIIRTINLGYNLHSRIITDQWERFFMSLRQLLEKLQPFQLLLLFLQIKTRVLTTKYFLNLRYVAEALLIGVLKF